MRYFTILCIALCRAADNSCPPEDTIKKLLGDVDNNVQKSLPQITDIVKDIADIVGIATGDSACFSDNVGTCIVQLLQSGGVFSDVTGLVGDGTGLFSDLVSSVEGVPWGCIAQDGAGFASQSLKDLEPLFSPFLDELKKLLDADEQLVKQIIKLLLSKIPGPQHNEVKSPISSLSQNITDGVQPLVNELNSMKSVSPINNAFGAQIDDVGSAFSNLTSTLSSLL